VTRRASITVCIITRDEERRLPRALESVRPFADELVVVDSGSTDRTRELAAAAGAIVIERPWEGFGAQRNVALDHANGDWVLELDGDEWCTPELARELDAFLAMPPPEGFHMGLLPMRETYIGRTLGPASHYPFYRSRLIRRGSYRHDEQRKVHEGLWPRERPWVFAHDLGHERASSLAEAFRDVWTYAGLEAQDISAVSLRALVFGTVVRPPLKFGYQAILLGGWRDGARGIMRSAMESLGDALTWVRAWPGAEGSTTKALDHFGRSAPRVGPFHLLAVGDPSPWWGWLSEAVEAGAWVSVICSSRHAGRALAGDEPLRVRTIPRLGPLALLRAIDAEAQLSPVDAHVALDGTGAAVLRGLPFASTIVRPRDVSASEVVRGVQR
jgi:hypothetical protein